MDALQWFRGMGDGGCMFREVSQKCSSNNGATRDVVVEPSIEVAKSSSLLKLSRLGCSFLRCFSGPLYGSSMYLRSGSTNIKLAYRSEILAELLFHRLSSTQSNNPSTPFTLASTRATKQKPPKINYRTFAQIVHYFGEANYSTCSPSQKNLKNGLERSLRSEELLCTSMNFLSIEDNSKDLPANIFQWLSTFDTLPRYASKYPLTDNDVTVAALLVRHAKVAATKIHVLLP
ncbi:hypothetical protein K449DRAFT_465758 [Hypoxylon sp. EC38]|nr:hypothetical protein K449DRAFT_465758 [Hypoxylon sp. EC38]